MVCEGLDDACDSKQVRRQSARFPLARNGGVLLAMALFFAAIGILFGLGRLKHHEYCVKRRLERQYAVDKVLATRSALTLNLLNQDLIAGREPLGYTNVFRTGMGERLEVRVLPVPPVLKSDMANTNALTAERWDKRDSMAEGTRILFNQPAGEKSVALFSCVNATGTVAKSCAIFRKVPLNWMETQFGLIYRLDPYAATLSKGFGRIRLYLLGMGDETTLTAANLDYHLGIKQALILETTASESAQAGAESAKRTLVLRNMPAVGASDVVHEDCIDADQKADDKIIHGAGFLLSGYHAVAFGENAMGDMLFSEAVNLKGRVDRAAFDQSWVIIEHVFPTNFPSATPLTVSIETFELREPMTFAISVFNQAVGSDYTPEVSTWELVTRYPNASQGKQGLFCVLDTFGAETTSLWKERRGEAPTQ